MLIIPANRLRWRAEGQHGGRTEAGGQHAGKSRAQSRAGNAAGTPAGAPSALFAAQEIANECGGIRERLSCMHLVVSLTDIIMRARVVRAMVDRFGRPPIARRAGLGAGGCIFFILSGMLGGCSFSEGVGPYISDPARYSAYHCKDMVDRLNELLTRENRLRNLIDKASEGTGGAVIGALAYRTDYEKALGEEKVLRRTAAEKKCELDPPVLQSDQFIR
jgi:hypothetical protein